MTENLILLQELYASHQKKIEILQKTITMEKYDIHIHIHSALITI